ncbi:MAG: hypothetical protein KBH71_08700, partial [Anaerolineae bacterium]|nr:hypothetical protein [Anaerolineae bacterium]
AGASVQIVFTATVNDDPALYGQTITNTARFTSANDGSGTADAAFTVKPQYRIFLPLVARNFAG